MKRVCITGACGFVGANLARALLAEGHEVHALIRSNDNAWRIKSIQADLRVHYVDLIDSDRVVQIIGQIRPEWIFHLAAFGAYSFQTDLARMIDTNIKGTVNLVNACLATGFETFVNTGSSSEYGFQDHPPAETELPEPNSHYAVTKASATLFCRFTAHHHNVHLPTLRLYSVYGAFEEPTRLIPTLITCGLQGQLPPLVNPNIARDYIYIDDVIGAYIAAAKHRNLKDSGPVYNVGTGIQTSLRQVVDVARQVMAIRAEPIWGSMPDRQWDTNVWVSDSSKIQGDLPWQPEFTFEQGLRQTIAWFQQETELRTFYERHAPTLSQAGVA